MFKGDEPPRYTDRVKAFGEDYPDYLAKKDPFTSSKAVEDFESWRFCANPQTMI